MTIHSPNSPIFSPTKIFLRMVVRMEDILTVQLAKVVVKAQLCCDDPESTEASTFVTGLLIELILYAYLYMYMCMYIAEWYKHVLQFSCMSCMMLQC